MRLAESGVMFMAIEQCYRAYEKRHGEIGEFEVRGVTNCVSTIKRMEKPREKQGNQTP